MWLKVDTSAASEVAAKGLDYAPVALSLGVCGASVRQSTDERRYKKTTKPARAELSELPSLYC